MPSPSPRDEDYLDDLLSEDAPPEEAAPMTGSSTEVLREIAADRKQTGAARVAAIRALQDSGAADDHDPASVALADWANNLSGEALDKELMGFMNGGWQPPPPPPPGSEDAITNEVESRFRRAIRAWAKTKGVRVEPSKAEPDRVAAQAPPKSVSEPQRPAEDRSAERMAKVIRLDTGEVLDFGAPMTQTQHNIAQSKLARQEARDRIREEKRKQHPFAAHIPKGTDPAVWDRTFR